MKNDKSAAYALRDSVMKMLSDDEVGRVSMAETGAALAAGDEYIDLGQMQRGVQQADSARTVMGRVLPRSAVHEGTWTRILSSLQQARDAAPPTAP